MLIKIKSKEIKPNMIQSINLKEFKK